MTVTAAEAQAQLNLDGAVTAELQLFVDAANAWIATKVSDTSPAPVRLATLFLVEHLWESQRGPAAIPSAADELVTVTGVGYAIPNRVKELLDPYLGSTSPTYAFPDAAAWPDAVEWPTS